MNLQKLPIAISSGDQPSAVERILSTPADGAISAFDLADALCCYLASARFLTLSDATNWLSGIVKWLPHSGPAADSAPVIVLEALIAVGTFGVGMSFGHKVLIPLPERTVMVPGVGRVRVGGVWEPASGPAFSGSVLAQAGKDKEAIPLLEAVGLTELTPEVAEDIRNLVGRARHGLPAEKHLEEWQMRLVVLLCSLDVADLKWKLSALQASALMEWAGIVPRGSSEDDSDPDQSIVVGLAASQRVIVSAGPGSGKTQVVCRRIAHLLENGTSASRIWLLSFTKVAVEELRKRIVGSVSSSVDVRALHVATFDSFASRILDAGLPRGAARPKSYDTAVNAAESILSSPPPHLQDYFGQLSHVVIDEAQDLLGARLTLVRRFIDLLPAECGVTILGDEAQSIYGWSVSRKQRQPSLIESAHGFEHQALRTDHRTKDIGLAGFFADARDLILSNAVSAADRYVGIRERIEGASTASVKSLVDAAIPAGGNTMILFRGRRALLSESHRLMSRGQPFRLRPSVHGQLIHPWIGALLAGLPLDTPVSRDAFADLFSHAAALFRSGSGDRPTLFGDLVVPQVVIDEAWQILRDLADNPGHRLNLLLLRRRLVWGSLPPYLLRDFLGNGGPVLSTIHGAKGLEADHVVLMLPRLPNAESEQEESNFNTPFDFEEEARVLYVGATRARRKLYTGSERSGKLRRLNSARSWRGYSGDFSIEIGVEGDVLPFVPADDSNMTGLVEAARALAAPGESPKARPGIAVRNERTGDYAVFRADSNGVPSGPALGLLSPSLLEVFAAVAKTRVSALPMRIGGFFLSGCATCIWGDDDEDDVGRRGIALVPVLCGLATISMETSR